VSLNIYNSFNVTRYIQLYILIYTRDTFILLLFVFVFIILFFTIIFVFFRTDIILKIQKLPISNLAAFFLEEEERKRRGV